MKNRIVYIISSLMLVLWTSCNEEGRIDHIDGNAPAPEQVSGITVRNTHGGAVLKYKLPDDKNLLYVKAVYERQPGVVCEVKSSYAQDSLVLNGFGDTRAYDVQIFSVGRNEKASEPLTETVHPLTPPVRLAAASLRETFGGVAIDVKNPEKINLAIVLMADTANVGYLSEVYTFYSSAEKGTFKFRGMEPIPYDVSVYLRDRWNNFSDTIYASVTPWFEEYIPKPWREYNLPGDTPGYYADLSVPGIWDDNTYNWDHSAYNSNSSILIPHIITWDFGKTVKLSRFKFYLSGQSSNYIWKGSHPSVFEIYGSETLPNPDGSLNGWIPLGRFAPVKPSGTGPAITEEDIAYAREGIDFDFERSDFAPDPNVPVRYMRFRTVKTFGSLTESRIQELSFWGTIIH